MTHTMSLVLARIEDWQYHDECLPMNVERIWAYYHMGW
jgi:hypothetical protein